MPGYKAFREQWVNEAKKKKKRYVHDNANATHKSCLSKKRGHHRT